nr:MAG TPA: hypothetical protein [Caudoviricetes sp.]DAQ36820.1 MAG TPA: hypothetical protein [Caudoviricetes sp.]DAW05052.1 MAG TPA: hypothetical protein [Caudoviricetes sp.]
MHSMSSINLYFVHFYIDFNFLLVYNKDVKRR